MSTGPTGIGIREVHAVGSFEQRQLQRHAEAIEELDEEEIDELEMLGLDASATFEHAEVARGVPDGSLTEVTTETDETTATPEHEAEQEVDADLLAEASGDLVERDDEAAEGIQPETVADEWRDPTEETEEAAGEEDENSQTSESSEWTVEAESAIDGEPNEQGEPEENSGETEQPTERYELRIGRDGSTELFGSYDGTEYRLRDILTEELQGEVELLIAALQQGQSYELWSRAPEEDKGDQLAYLMTRFELSETGEIITVSELVFLDGLRELERAESDDEDLETAGAATSEMTDDALATTDEETPVELVADSTPAEPVAVSTDDVVDRSAPNEQTETAVGEQITMVVRRDDVEPVALEEPGPLSTVGEEPQSELEQVGGEIVFDEQPVAEGIIFQSAPEATIDEPMVVHSAPSRTDETTRPNDQTVKPIELPTVDRFPELAAVHSTTIEQRAHPAIAAVEVEHSTSTQSELSQINQDSSRAELRLPTQPTIELPEAAPQPINRSPAPQPLAAPDRNRIDTPSTPPPDPRPLPTTNHRPDRETPPDERPSGQPPQTVPAPRQTDGSTAKTQEQLTAQRAEVNLATQAQTERMSIRHVEQAPTSVTVERQSTAAVTRLATERSVKLTMAERSAAQTAREQVREFLAEWPAAAGQRAPNPRALSERVPVNSAFVTTGAIATRRTIRRRDGFRRAAERATRSGVAA